MRIALAIAAVTLLILTGCNTLREAADVAARLTREPTEAELAADKQQVAANIDAAEAQLKAIKDSGREPTQAEMRALAEKVVSGQPVAQQGKQPSNTPPPADQEISVNLTFAGLNNTTKGNLDFDFKALWGSYKVTSKELSMPARAGSSEAKLDLGVAKLRVVPKIISSTHGRYDVEFTDKSGALIGRFNIAKSGKQVEITGQPSKYRAELAYFDDERRLTGYSIMKAGSREEQLGIIFVGKGWSFVENAKKPDLSKGYIFPEMDIVVLPKAWLDANEMKDTCKTLKRGEIVAGGVCYS
jgi:hypothetical protein